MKHKVIVVAGARPNFVKVAPLMRALRARKCLKPVLVHTGQHYDFKMSEIFFQELRIPEPDIYLNVKASSHAAQTAGVMAAFEDVLLKEKPALVFVVGDVNSTLACTLAAAKVHVPVAHVEAGLRSFDRSMPEEVNRVATDVLSDFLFVSEESGVANLKKQGISPSKIFHAGNVMIDSLLANRSRIARSTIAKKLGLPKKPYAVVTLHRPANVDAKAPLSQIYGTFRKISKNTAIVYPVHPRTRSRLKQFGLLKRFQSLPGLRMTEPLGYCDFLKLVSGAQFVLTDSGGIQEEATVLGVPCLTMRENTERPSTVLLGTNVLVGREQKKILSLVKRIQAGRWKKGRIPKFWDGRAAERIAAKMETILKK